MLVLVSDEYGFTIIDLKFREKEGAVEEASLGYNNLEWLSYSNLELAIRGLL
jgi:hypothetical protein